MAEGRVDKRHNGSAGEFPGSTCKASIGAVFATCEHSYPQGDPQAAGVSSGLPALAAVSAPQATQNGLRQPVRTAQAGFALI